MATGNTVDLPCEVLVAWMGASRLTPRGPSRNVNPLIDFDVLSGWRKVSVQFLDVEGPGSVPRICCAFSVTERLRTVVLAWVWNLVCWSAG